MEIEHKTKIDKLISSKPIFMFMKGTVDEPSCRFSFHAVHLLKLAGAKEIGYLDVLIDDTMRQAIKDYTSWPTIPQIFIDGEFVGGADVIQDLFDRGELKALVAA